MWNVNVIEQVLRGRAVMFLFPSSCRARQRREGSWDNGGGSGVGESVCVCVCCRCMCLVLWVSREAYWEERNEYWFRINAHNLHSSKCQLHCEWYFLYFGWLQSPCTQHDAKYGSCRHSDIHLYCQSVIASFVPFTHHSCFFLSVLSVCSSLSVFLLQTVVVSILVEMQCGSEVNAVKVSQQCFVTLER